MSYVIAAWLACAVILALYAARTVQRERSLKRSLRPKSALRRAGLAPEESR